jgi:hypothetical protein
MPTGSMGDCNHVSDDLIHVDKMIIRYLLQVISHDGRGKLRPAFLIERIHRSLDRALWLASNSGSLEVGH